jgi:aspartate/methionine/tyrosine aminotransferase
LEGNRIIVPNSCFTLAIFEYQPKMFHKDETPIADPESEILLTVGGKESVFLTIQALTNPG